MERLNITLPEEIAQKIQNLPNKSRFIAEALKEKLERKRKERLDRLLIEGYRATKEEDRRIAEEWEKITLKGWK
ncbi:MAG: hypothetical protein U9Q24_03205 [Candidatus Ratteibacteria bacterium]|nr:hypothetical protein [Candidatus Ratteibacteria bacterium]